jgi:ribosomal subunit interface protein
MENFMELSPQITFRGMASSEAIEAQVRDRIDKLDRFHPRIMSCRVVVECGPRHQTKGRLYQVSIDIKVPGREIVVGREPANHAHDDMNVAIRGAFDAARRQLEDVARRASR